MITGTHTGQYTNATSSDSGNVVNFAAYSIRSNIKNTPVYRHPDFSGQSEVVQLSEYRH